MLKRILIAYNGSDEGRRMLIASSELAEFARAETHLLAVANIPWADLYVAEGITPVDLIGDGKNRAQEILDEGIAQLKERGFAVVGHLAEGDPVEEICRLAVKLDCDLIVVGHGRKSPLARWWQQSFGKRSVGKSLLDNAPCAVLIVLDKVQV